jgi:glycyl-tRNA synthetase beta chain
MKKLSPMKHVSRVSRPASPPANDLLFEIGTEELPAAYLSDLIEQLDREAKGLLEAAHLSCRRIDAFGTPRRLVLLVHGLSTVQRKPTEEIRGPAQQAAYDGEGQPTKALLGFLRAKGGRLDQTKLVASNKGAYVYLVKPPAASPTAKALPELLQTLVGRLRAPKTMRWDASDLRFARPIRWVTALYGRAPTPCRIGRVSSSPHTQVGLPLHPRAVRVTSIEHYVRILRGDGVLLDHGARRETIEQTIMRLAKSSGARPAPEMVSHGLLDEVTFLTERPTPLVGSFDRTYLQLPREVLLASMAKYQRVFAVESSGALRPQFIAMLDGQPKRLPQVRRVFERILNARLADSLLFWNDDHAQLPLERMAAGLSGVTVHERLGSMADKTLRLRTLSEPLADAWQLSEEECSHLRKACHLAKADLVSTMVKEFPTLQGVVGKYYARDSQEPEAVAVAIEEQYLPLGNRMPKTLIGSALALLDKYDTLTAYYGLGIEPTGDQDPFGLRRAAQGIVEIAWAVRRPLPLDQLLRIRGTLEPFRKAQPRDIAAVGHRVQRYLFDRLPTFAWPAPAAARGGPGPAPRPTPDCIEAALSSARDDLTDVMERIHTLQQLSGHPGLLRAAKVIERTRNILKGATLRQPQVNPALLHEPTERHLWDLYVSHQDRLAQLARSRAYAEATTLFGDTFYQPLHEFFDRVLVNAPEEALQQNRLALMKAINTLYTDGIADLSKLAILQREAAVSPP